MLLSSQVRTESDRLPQADRTIARGVAFNYAEFSLGPVNLTLAPGSIYGLIGPNGAGKTTLLRSIAGLLPGATGDITIGSDNVDALQRRSAVGFSQSDNIWYQELTFREHLRFIRKFYAHWDVRRESELVDRFALPLSKRVGSASAGMLVKFSLLVTLCRNSRLLLFDEPWNALDPAARIEFSSLIESISRSYSLPIVLSSHELPYAQTVCDCYLFLLDGRIVAEGGIDDLACAAELPKGTDLLDIYLKVTGS